MEENNGKEERRGRMTSVQYEAVCRHAISRIYGVGLEEIHGGHLLGVTNRRQKTRHQIDLYWDVSDGTFVYRVFANAKWRTDNVEVMDIMALIGVWRDIGAHKAVLITNTGFDIGVKKQAEEKGIGLLIVRPCVEFEGLGRRNVAVVAEQVEKIAAEKGEEVFKAEVVHKGWGGGVGSGQRAVGSEGGHGDAETGGRGEEGGGIWLVGGMGGEVEEGGVENKAMGDGAVANKMMGGSSGTGGGGKGIWRKG